MPNKKRGPEKIMDINRGLQELLDAKGVKSPEVLKNIVAECCLQACNCCLQVSRERPEDNIAISKEIKQLIEKSAVHIR